MAKVFREDGGHTATYWIHDSQFSRFCDAHRAARSLADESGEEVIVEVIYRKPRATSKIARAFKGISARVKPKTALIRTEFGAEWVKGRTFPDELLTKAALVRVTGED